MTSHPIKKKHKLFSLYYENDGFNISGDKLMGRQAAGWSFLKSLIVSKRYDRLGIYIKNLDQKKLLLKDVESLLTEDNKSIDITTIPYIDPKLSEPFGGIQLPGPDLTPFSNHRSFFGHEKYSLCGITHTTASYEVMNSISSVLTEPVMPWDAIICTSQSVHNTVNKILDVRKEFLHNRFNTSSYIQPKFPIIPLGINNDEFNFSDNFKKESRESFNIKEGDIVISYVGRLSFHAKAHHIPMYMALEKCSQTLKGNKKIHLIQTGWFANDFIENTFKEESKTICPSVSCTFLDGRDQLNKSKTLAASDIFMSLSDNIQETFGLTPLEAMASGIPVIVSDWDGYRSTVRDNKDGFRVKTYALDHGSGEELMYQYIMGSINYDNYIGNTVHKVGTDVKDCIDKLTELIENVELRLKFGKNGKKRSLTDFSWESILDQYEDLYNELDDVRLNTFSDNKIISNVTLPSNRMDPFVLFDDYPTEILKGDTKLFTLKNLHSFKIDEILGLNSTTFAFDIPNNDDFAEIISLLNNDTFSTINELKNKTSLNIITINKIIIFLIKYGYLSDAKETK